MEDQLLNSAVSLTSPVAKSGQIQPQVGKSAVGQQSCPKLGIAGKHSKSKQTEVSEERIVEATYREQVLDRATYRAQPEGPRNGRWTGSGVRAPKQAPYVQLEGRVALRDPDPSLAGITEFYIGHSYGQVDGVDVFNWRNPLGRLFFDCAPRERPTTHAAAGADIVNRRVGATTEFENVAVVRTFDHQEGVIADFVDDILCEAPPQPVFGRPMSSSFELAKQPQSSDSAHRHSLHSSAGQGAGVVAPKDNEALCEPLELSFGVDVADVPRYVRAERLLINQLLAPRTRTLTPVLSTLQPEQYRLITTHPRDSMIVEGGPGTGKSIIASHRAAYFVGADGPPDFDGEVFVIGPTSEYLEYISGAIGELTEKSSRIKVLSMHEMLSSQTRTNVHEQDHEFLIDFTGSTTTLDVLVRAAHTRLTNGRDTTLTVAQVYEYLRGNGSRSRPLTKDPAWLQFFGNLPQQQPALPTAAFRDVCASIEKHLAAMFEGLPLPAPSYRHVIVDEAQDVTAEEWLMLRQLNLGGAWTILGDFHQRRADKTPQKWSTVMRAVGLSPDTPQHCLKRGYRSTSPIVEFANRLLPSEAEPPMALRSDGPGPLIVNQIREQLGSTVIRQIDRLIDKYPGGTIAIITTTPGPLNQRLKAEPERSNVVVITPNNARGLEFDAVIVVEPSDFPRNDHRRHGLLYTALTRPNKELVIVHSKELPLQLQNISRSSPRPQNMRPKQRAVVVQPPKRSVKQRRKKARRTQ